MCVFYALPGPLLFQLSTPKCGPPLFLVCCRTFHDLMLSHKGYLRTCCPTHAIIMQQKNKKTGLLVVSLFLQLTYYVCYTFVSGLVLLNFQQEKSYLIERSVSSK